MRQGITLMAICFGSGLIALSLILMIDFHEFAIADSLFLIGGIIVALAWLASFRDAASTNPKINIPQINKNIQTLNDILWGKEKPAINLMTENDWQATIQDGCRDIRHTWGPAYCVYGGKRGYCIFERCPRRNK